MAEESNCAICQSDCTREGLGVRLKWKYDCPVCGGFVIANDAELEVNELDGSQRALLSGCVRERADHKQPVEIRATNLKDILSTAPSTLNEKLLKLLSRLVDKTEYFGSTIWLDDSDRAIGYAINGIEFQAEIHYLEDARFIHQPDRMSDGRFGITVTAQGISMVEQANRDGGQFSNRAFVAMSFDKSLDFLFEHHITDAIQGAGYDKPLRVDREHYNDRIDDQIVVGLKQCKFVVADFTFQRNGVYYEAGFAHGQGKQVIMCCPKSEEDNLHFDTSHIKHIIYETGEELGTRLKERILATIGPGRNYVPVP
jgi:hypothetical protein